MKDFKERLEAAFKRGLNLYRNDATIKVTRIADRLPLPVDEDKARTCPGAATIYDERSKGKVYYVVQVFYSEEYAAKHAGSYFANPISQTCYCIVCALGLGQMALASAECDGKKVELPFCENEEVYAHLPPLTACNQGI